jgi:hypothetical protein
LASIVPAGYGGLDYANGIAISPYTGNLLVASVRTASVKEYEHSPGACEAVYKGNFVTSIVASGIAFGPDGYLYATDFNNDRVLRFNGETGAPDFPIFEAKGCGLDGPTGLTFSPDGSLLVGSQYTHNIVAYDTKTGAACCVVADGCGLDTPVGLALLPDNRLLVASFQTNSIVAFDLEAPDLSARCMPAFVEPGICGLSGPQGLALTSDGRLLVSSMHTDAVLQFDAATGAELAPCQLAQGCPLDGPTYLVATRGRESNVFHAWTFPYNAFIERPLYDCGTPLLKSDPVCDATLPKFQNNTARLTFAGPLGGRPTPGQVLIQQLLPSGGFGADLSTSFSFTVEPGNILRIQDNGNSLQNGRWYAVRNTGGWTGVGAFEVDYAVVVGDADNTGLSDFADLSFIFGNLTGAAADDDRNDVNADGFVDFADISDAFGFNGSFAPLKPTGHECRP